MDGCHGQYRHRCSMVNIVPCLTVPPKYLLNGLCRSRAGIDALALDPQDDSKVYIAVGEYTNR